MVSKAILPSCGLCLLGALQDGRADSPAGRQSPLAGVPGLQRRVSCTEAKTPLGELVRKLSAATGVSLSAAREVADEPVAVVVSDSPASRVLDEVAELLDYRWARVSRDGAPRYEIYQDLRGRKQEEALRQAALGDVERRLVQEVGALIQVGSLPEPRYRELEQAAQQRRPGGAPLPPEQARQLRAVRQLASPVQRLLARVLGRLTDQDWEALRGGELLRFSDRPGAGRRELPEGAAAMLRGFQPGDHPLHQRRPERSRCPHFSARRWSGTKRSGPRQSGSTW